MIHRPFAFLFVASCVACATVSDPGQVGDGDGDGDVGDGDGDGDGDLGDGDGTGGSVVVQTGGSSTGGTAGSTGGTTGTGGILGSGGNIPEGPLLFQDDFEDGLGQWTLSGTWTEASDGTTVLSQERIIDTESGTISSDDRGYQSAFTGSNWAEYTLSARVKLTFAEDNSASYAGLLICAADGGTGLVVGFKGTGEVRLRELSGGVKGTEGSPLEDLSENELVIQSGTWYGVEVILLAGGSMQIKIDGTFYAVDLPEGYICGPGGIGLVTERASAVFDDVYVSTE